MKTLFRKMLAGALLTALFLNVNVDVLAQWTTNGTNDAYNTNTSGKVGIGTSSSIFSPFQVGVNLNKFSVGKIGGAGWERAYIGFNAGYDGTNWNVFSVDDDDDHGGAIITTSEDGTLNFYTVGVGGHNGNDVVSNTSFFTNSLGFQIIPGAGVQIPGSSGNVSAEGNITAMGKIGIGTYTPSCSLSVNGNVKIGDQAITTPAGYNLYVSGGILTEKIKIGLKNSANWADFVFDKSYKLMPLAQVEKYINKNKHLPDVPSAEEMVNNGLDVATMDAKLLQKIEELTLYMIEMKKENEDIKKQNEKLINDTKELKKEVGVLKAKN